MGQAGPRLARKEQPHLGMWCRHSCMCCGDCPSPPLGVSGFRLEKLTSPTPSTGSANGWAGWGGKGGQFPELGGVEGFAPTIHAVDSS